MADLTISLTDPEREADLKERRRRSQEKWNARNRDKLKGYYKKWREMHPERAKEVKARHRAANLKKIREADRQAKQRRREAVRAAGTEAVESFRAAARAWYANWKINNRDKIAANSRRWREKMLRLNPDALRQMSAKSYRRNKASSYAASRRWLLEHPERRRVYEATRRAREAAIEGRFSAADVSFLFEKQRGKCALCRTSIRRSYEIDHIKALARGGDNGRRNIQLLCRPCNRRKHAKDPVDFAREMGLLI